MNPALNSVGGILMKKSVAFWLSSWMAGSHTSVTDLDASDDMFTDGMPSGPRMTVAWPERGSSLWPWMLISLMALVPVRLSLMTPPTFLNDSDLLSSCVSAAIGNASSEKLPDV